MASIDTDYRQVKPRELGPKPSCRRSSLKPNPNRARRFRPHEPSNRFRDRIDDAFSDNQSLLIHHADRRLLQRHVQSNIAFHCASPSLLGPHEADPSIPGELIPYALVWLDPGITPCCKSRKSNNPKNLAKVDLCASLLPRGFSVPLRRSVIDFDETIWSLTSRRVKRISASRIFRSSPQKDFCNKIGHKPTCANARPAVQVASIAIIHNAALSASGTVTFAKRLAVNAFSRSRGRLLYQGSLPPYSNAIDAPVPIAWARRSTPDRSTRHWTGPEHDTGPCDATCRI